MAVDVAPSPASPPGPVRRRMSLAPCPSADVERLERELGVSGVVAQVLVRRGLAHPDAARAWLAAGDAHPCAAFSGMEDAVAVMRRHLAAGSAITVHGDYDVDGVCSTAILVRALRSLGGAVDAYLPSRTEDGYGLNARTVERLAARGTRLLVTADCAITAVDEVALARTLGMEVVVTDHHTPRADGSLPGAPIVHPALGGYPCAELCAAGVALKVAEALGAPTAAQDLDLAALATVADVVALRGENRRLVREGLRAIATTSKPGLRALMAVARCDPSRLDARAVGFRLAPRINAAGRLYRADAGLELVLTGDRVRADAIAEELDRANAERRQTEQRILWEAEAQVLEQGERMAYVVAGEGWHPGVVGIVASRLAERFHRPAVVIALDGDEGTGSGRSIPAFDLLGGLDACAAYLLRHGGHRAAAGLQIATGHVDGFRAAFEAHAADVLCDDDLVREQRVDAIASGGDLGRSLAEELERLAPFGHGNPDVALLVPAARLVHPRAMGEGRHVRFTVEAGGVRAKAVAFGSPRLPVEEGEPVDAVFCLELDEYQGVVEPRLVLRHAAPCDPGPVTIAGEPAEHLTAALAQLDAALPVPCTEAADLTTARDRRHLGIAGTVAGLTATGERVLVVCADARARARHLASRLGGVALCSWDALERDLTLAAAYDHVVALDPPCSAAHRAALAAVRCRAHLAWGEPERAFAAGVAERDLGLRPSVAALYRSLRAGTPLPAALAEIASPVAAGRALRVLAELGLVALDRDRLAVEVPPAERTELERSPAFRAWGDALAEARALLGVPPGGPAPDRRPPPAEAQATLSYA